MTRSESPRALLAAGLVLAATQAVAPYLSTLIGFGVPIGDQGGNDPPIVPAGYAFAVWGVIFTGCLAYGVFQALPQQRASPLLRRVRPPAAAAFLATTVWSVLALREWLAATVVCMVAILVSLARAYARLATWPAPLTRAERWLVRFPLSVFFGWITLATVANTAAALRFHGVRDPGVPDATWAAGMALVAGIIAAAVTRVGHGNAPYALTVVWGLAGVAVANRTRYDNPGVVMAAGVAAGLVCVALARSPRAGLDR